MPELLICSRSARAASKFCAASARMASVTVLRSSAARVSIDRHYIAFQILQLETHTFSFLIHFSVDAEALGGSLGESCVGGCHLGLEGVGVLEVHADS